MTLGIVFASLLTYAAGWLTTTVAGSRWYANSIETCHQQSRSGSNYRWRNQADCNRYCKPGCWHVDGRITPNLIGVASLIALLWPVLAFPAIAYWLANRKLTPAGLRRSIAELEREVGIQ